MKSSGPMLSHTLITMHWLLDLSSCRVGLQLIHKEETNQGIHTNVALDVLLSPAKNLGNLLGYMQTYKWYESCITAELRATVHIEGRALYRRAYDNGQPPTPTSWHRWRVEMDKLIINTWLNGLNFSVIIACVCNLYFGWCIIFTRRSMLVKHAEK